MARIVLAPALARWLRDSDDTAAAETSLEVAGASLADALDAAFRAHPRLRGYVVDDRGAVRHHVAIFVDGVAIGDKTRLAVPIAPNAEIYVMQALSGG